MVSPNGYRIVKYSVDEDGGDCPHCHSELFCNVGDTNYEILDLRDMDLLEAGFDSESCAKKWLENWCKREK